MSKITDTSRKPMFEWLFGGNPDAIEQQEAEGQEELVQSSQLPVKVNTPRDVYALEQYKIMGIAVINETPDDKLFLDVELPEGWQIKATGHSMWSDLLDNKGRKRASIFYIVETFDLKTVIQNVSSGIQRAVKAAFYDRDAFINFEHKISLRVDRLGFLQGDYTMTDGDYTSRKTPFVGRVIDCDGSVLFETKHCKCDAEYNENDPRKGYTEKYVDESYEVQKVLEKECMAYLNENYPNYEDINAYWD